LKVTDWLLPVQPEGFPPAQTLTLPNTPVGMKFAVTLNAAVTFTLHVALVP
jgi:hypothetical protein